MIRSRLHRLRAYLAGGASTTSWSRGARLAIAVVACAVPAYFALKLVTNSGAGAMAALLGLVLFGAPLVVILPGLLQGAEQLSRADIARRREERSRAAGLVAAGEAEAPASTWAQRPEPPTRW